MKHFSSRHHQDLKIVSIIGRCPLHRGSSQIDLFCFKNLTGVLVYNVIDPRVCQETGVGRRKSLKKVLNGKCLQCVKEPIIKVDKNAAAVVLTKKRWLVMRNRNLHDCIHVSIPIPLCFGHLCYWETCQTWKWTRTKNPCKFLWIWKDL